jgi:hypothetical protein
MLRIGLVDRLLNSACGLQLGYWTNKTILDRLPVLNEKQPVTLVSSNTRPTLAAPKVAVALTAASRGQGPTYPHSYQDHQ